MLEYNIASPVSKQVAVMDKEDLEEIHQRGWIFLGFHKQAKPPEAP
jgi:hypothetical protein